MYLFNLKAVFRIRFFLTDPDPDLDPTQKPKADPDPKYCLKEHKSGTILFLYRSCNFMYREEIQTCLFFSIIKYNHRISFYKEFKIEDYQ